MSRAADRYISECPYKKIPVFLCIKNFLMLNRIRDSITTLQATVNIPANETIMFTRNTFAIQVKSVQSDEYVGEVFNVDLGNIEQAMNLSRTIMNEDLKTLMEVLDNSTASISATSSLLDQRASCQVGADRRVGYSVFRTTSLFPSDDSDTVTSLIIGITVSCNRTQVTDDSATDDSATDVSVTLQSNKVTLYHPRINVLCSHPCILIPGICLCCI